MGCNSYVGKISPNIPLMKYNAILEHEINSDILKIKT